MAMHPADPILAADVLNIAPLDGTRRYGSIQLQSSGDAESESGHPFRGGTPPARAPAVPVSIAQREAR